MAHTFFNWTDKMSVRSEEIDNQHKQLVEFLNEIYQAFMEKAHKEKIGTIIDKMSAYTKYHFETEEKYFEYFDYYDKEDHIREHDNFRNRVDEFVTKYKASNGALTYEVMNFLKNWLTSHIMDTDQKYVNCFSRNGVK